MLDNPAVPMPDNAAKEKVDEILEIERLAGLSPIEYDRERESAAEKLEIRVATLDALVKARRPGSETKGQSPRRRSVVAKRACSKYWGVWCCGRCSRPT